MVRALSGVVLPAALVILAFGPITAAQQLDLSPALVANPAAAAVPDAQPGAQQQLNLSASACGPAGQREQMKVTFVDEHHNAWYRATVRGLNLTGERGLRVIGALLPRWNLAAQMGASGTAPGNTVNAMAWATPNEQVGASPYSTPRVRVVWMPTLALCPTP